MSVTKLPQGPRTGQVITFPAPGKPQRPHPSAGPFRPALEWFMRVRVLQIADGLTYEEAAAQALAEWRSRR